MTSPGVIFFILIQSCIWRIWFLIESLCFTPPSSPLRHIPWFTLPIKPSSPLLSHIRRSLSTYRNSLGSTSQCMYATMMWAAGGRRVAEPLTDLFLKNNTSVLEIGNTLAIALVCKVLSWFRHVELFKTFSKASWVYKCIVWYHFKPTLGYEATCMSKVMHLRWSIALRSASDTVCLGYTPRQYSLLDCDHIHTTNTHSSQNMHTVRSHITQQLFNIFPLPSSCRKLSPLTCDTGLHIAMIWNQHKSCQRYSEFYYPWEGYLFECYAVPPGLRWLYQTMCSVTGIHKEIGCNRPRGCTVWGVALS